MSTAFAGERFTFANPDGAPLEVRGWGNQFTAVFETLDGYTVVKEPVSGVYQYARQSADGTGLEAGGTPATATAPAGLAVEQHLRAAPETVRAQARAAHDIPGQRRRWEVRREQRHAALRAAAPDDATAAPPAAVTTGNYVGLCLLLQFPDVPGTITRTQVTDFCNQPGYTGFGNNGSARDYFLAVSGGKLNYSNQVTAYYTALHPRAHYTDETIANGVRAQELIREALDSLVASGFNFSGLSSDAGGFVYALSAFYAGGRVNNWSKGLWPHSWTLGTTYTASPTKKFADYQITDMGASLTLRTFCHENGHMVCDFPDLYDYGGQGNGVGNYCLMCFGGPDTNPVQVGAYLKKEAGWASSLTTMAPATTATVTAGANDFLIHSRSATEYYILENRQQSGRDAALPDAGLAIWHVDELGSNDNEQMTAAQHYECSLEQADNAFDLERRVNGGNGTDLYGGPAAPSFGPATAPNSTWWDGTASGLDVELVSGPGASMTVTTRGAVVVPLVPEQDTVSGVDVTGDGRADVVGFGDAGMYVSLNDGLGAFGLPVLAISDFGYLAGGWRVDKHPRHLADLTGDGRADVIGFSDAGMVVAPNTGGGTFGPRAIAINDFGYVAGGWRVDKHPRMLADLTGDGRADVVGFGDAGMYVSLNDGAGRFAPPVLAIAAFGHLAGGWRVDQHPRMLADLTGDGRADVIGFGNAGMYVALNNGDGTFAASVLAIHDFGQVAGGWRVDKHPRMLADLTGDGRADVIGFGDAGMFVALNTGGGTFAPPVLAIAGFGYVAGNWRVDRHPRMLADLTGDHRADLVGFGNAGAYVALSNGDGTFAAPVLALHDFGYVAGGWRIENHPRFLADLHGQARSSIGGFSDVGMKVARSHGNGTFAPPVLAIADFGATAGGWRTNRHPRVVVGRR